MSGAAKTGDRVRTVYLIATEESGIGSAPR